MNKSTKSHPSFSIKLALFIGVSVLNSSFIPAEQDYDKLYVFTVEEASAVAIEGSTNVNQFTCDYTGSFKNKSLSVQGKSNGLIVALKGANFQLEVDHFDCHNYIMTKDFKHTLKYEEHPFVLLEVLQIGYDNERSESDAQTTLKTKMEVIAAGKSKELFVDTHRKYTDKNKAVFSGEFDIKIEDFGINPPSKAFGMIKVNSILNIKYKFHLTRTKA